MKSVRSSVGTVFIGWTRGIKLINNLGPSVAGPNLVLGKNLLGKYSIRFSTWRQLVGVLLYLWQVFHFFLQTCGRSQGRTCKLIFDQWYPFPHWHVPASRDDDSADDRSIKPRKHCTKDCLVSQYHDLCKCFLVHNSCLPTSRHDRLCEELV